MYKDDDHAHVGQTQANSIRSFILRILFYFLSCQSLVLQTCILCDLPYREPGQYHGCRASLGLEGRLLLRIYNMRHCPRCLA